jgi:DNA polymerase I
MEHNKYDRNRLVVVFMNCSRIMIIDGNSILNRAFYGLQGRSLLQNKDGLYTNAIYGFLNILFKYMQEEDPGYICVAFDLKAPTFRHIDYENYKAGRKGMPEELAVQVPVIKEVLDAMNIARLEKEGFEADDIIGAISLDAENEGLETVVVTGDRDALQLASQKTRIRIPSTRAGKTEINEYDYNTVVEKYGVSPLQLIEVKGLMGDKSDNIPGVPGIGEKTALCLIKEFGSIENIYSNIDSVSKDALREKLKNNREIAFMSRNLSAIRREIPDMLNLEHLKRTEYNNEKLLELFNRLEFRSLINKLDLKKKNSEMKNQTLSQTNPIDLRCINELNELKALTYEIAMAGELAILYFLESKEKFDIRLRALAFSWNKNSTAYIELGGNICEEEFLKEFREIFEDEQIKKTGHDIKPLIVYLMKRGISFNGLVFDTMIAAYIANPTRSVYPIDELSQEYLGKSIQTLERHAEAGCINSSVLSELSVVFKSTMTKREQERLYYDIELPLVSVLADMETRGFKVNREMLLDFSKELETGIDILTHSIFEMTGESFNINSTKQLGTILFDKLGLPAGKKTKTGYSTNADVLESLISRHEIIPHIISYRQLVKLKSTYVEGLLNVINPATGRIHTSFNQTVTSTGRISSTEPNLQNIPIKLEMGKKIRKVFTPENNDYILTSADYSQIELRVLAHISGDENMIEAFKKNEDIHTSTASKIFGVSPGDVTLLMRSRAKAVNFGIVYGIGDFSLSKDIGTTRSEAHDYIEGYLDRYPGVRQYMKDIVEKGSEYGYVKTMFNRIRFIPELKSKNHNIREFGKRIALNTPIQGSAADIIKIAMVKAHSELKKNGLKSGLILQVHDELIVETHISEKEKVADILKKCMEGAANMKVPLKADIKTGINWYEAK